MKSVLLTGATGYIGRRIIPLLLIRGYHVICLVRDVKRFENNEEEVEVVECDFLNEKDVSSVLNDRKVDYAYYLMHSMSSKSKSFEKLEMIVARNFVQLANRLSVIQTIYLTGMVNEDNLSPHLRSRKLVEDILSTGKFHLTAVRAGIIIGSGSSSFEIIRDLVEKLPVMVAPRWIKSKCQPIAIRDVLKILIESLGNEQLYDRDFDIGGPDILTYMDMLNVYAKVRNLKRHIYVVPVLTPRLSSYWFQLVTSQPYSLARHLVDSMRIDFIARDNELIDILDIKPISYEDSIRFAFDKIKQNGVVSSWKDTMFYSKVLPNVERYVDVPEHGCMKDTCIVMISDERSVIDQIWEIGKNKRWYYWYWLWELRGFIDKVIGGVGFNRHRREDNNIHIGDSIDFWRVINADYSKGILLLYAEMKLPGEAWLGFKVGNGTLIQTATFRPRGVWGRIYWYGILPLHKYMFKGMARKIVKQSRSNE